MSKATSPSAVGQSRRPRSGRLMAKAVVFQIIAFSVLLLGLRQQLWSSIVAGLIVIAAVLILVPFKKLNLLDRASRRARFRRRARTRATNSTLPTDLVPLGEWVPGLAVKQTRSARGEDVGVITDGSSWTALLGISSDDNLFADRDDRIDLAALQGLTVQDDIVFAALQVITFTVPAPAAVMLTPDSLALASYGQILAKGQLPPAVRRSWIGVRLDPRLCLEAVASRGASDEGIYATLRFGLHRVQSALKRQGITTHELTALEISDVLATTSGSTPDFGAQRSSEGWDHWWCDGFVHCGRQITSWGAEPSVGYQQLLDALAGAPIIFGVTSYTLDRWDHAAGAVRVVGPNPDAAQSAMAELTHRLGAGLVIAPSGGDQVPALLATVPLGREVMA